MNLGHLMIDLETMGTKTDSAIVSIGAVEFDINTGETGREFYEVVNLQSAIDAGLKVYGDTVMWWLQQSEKARERLFSTKGKNLNETLYLFRVFLQYLGTKELKVWGNGARFDLGCLNYAYNSINKDIPWYFRHERDVRTLVSFAPEIKENMIFTGTQHDPIDDCKFQIKYCSEIWKKINK